MALLYSELHPRDLLVLIEEKRPAVVAWGALEWHGDLESVGAEARYGHDQYREFGRPERLFHHAIPEFRQSAFYLEWTRPDRRTMA